MATLNYNHLRYFWAVAHDGNLTRTAEKLNVSQSALSLQIKKLEERLDQALFERRGKQLILTEAGRIALDHADAIFAAGEELLATLQSGVHEARKTLRVGALATLSRNFQLEFLRPLLTAEDAGLVLRSGGMPELLRLLEARQIDVVLTDQPPRRDAGAPWLVSTLAEQRVSLIGAPTFASTPVGTPADLAALLESERLIVPTIESSIRLRFDTLTEKLKIRPKIFAEVDDMALIRLLAREENALAVIPPIVVQGELITGRLIEVAPLPDLKEVFFAVALARRFENPLLTVVMEREPDERFSP